VYVHPTAPDSRQALSRGLGVDLGLASHAGHNELALPGEANHARRRHGPAAAAQDSSGIAITTVLACTDNQGQYQAAHAERSADSAS
jgi:hypothetical protein